MTPTVGFFVPCYIDQFYPQVAIATLELLERLGCRVVVPRDQTCCGQPMANSGFASMAGSCSANFQRNFSNCDYIVAPSGSCVLHVKEHIPTSVPVYELTEFLVDVLHVDALPARFPHRVGLHTSCHGQRMLGLASMSERMEPAFSKAEALLGKVADLELHRPKRPDECCGFGGTFCVTEASVSVAMGEDRIAEHEANGVAFITGGDTSCLMHLEGILKRRKSPIRVIHLAQILNAQ